MSALPVAATLNKLPEVMWDRFAGDGTDHVSVFGWIAREAGKFDYAMVMIAADGPWLVSTSSARYSAEFSRRLGMAGAGHSDCRRVEDHFADVRCFRGRGEVPAARPRIVCLCGSTRFGEAFQAANLRETIAGNIVLSIGCDMKSDADIGLPADTKAKLDELHLRKIDLADEVLVLNVGGYIGQSTARELAYARECGKVVRFLVCPECKGEDWWDTGKVCRRCKTQPDEPRPWKGLVEAGRDRLRCTRVKCGHEWIYDGAGGERPLCPKCNSGLAAKLQPEGAGD